MTAPLIGVSIGFADYGDYVGVGYSRPLLRAGAMPVLLPFIELAHDQLAMIEQLDGLVIAGGRDVPTARYGRSAQHPRQGEAAQFRDDVEFNYVEQCLELDVPLLGVCRGCQVINVANGGTLFGDLDEAPTVEGFEHPSGMWVEWAALTAATLAGVEPDRHPAHPITIRDGSILSEHMGQRAVVNSYHHQAIDRLGDGVEAVAWAPDGVVEAIEVGGARFALGVQWEIQEDWQHDERSLGVWQGLVAAAAKRRADR